MASSNKSTSHSSKSKKPAYYVSSKNAHIYPPQLNEEGYEKTNVALWLPASSMTEAEKIADRLKKKWAEEKAEAAKSLEEATGTETEVDDEGHVLVDESLLNASDADTSQPPKPPAVGNLGE